MWKDRYLGLATTFSAIGAVGLGIGVLFAGLILSALVGLFVGALLVTLHTYELITLKLLTLRGSWRASVLRVALGFVALTCLVFATPVSRYPREPVVHKEFAKVFERWIDQAWNFHPREKYDREDQWYMSESYLDDLPKFYMPKTDRARVKLLGVLYLYSRILPETRRGIIYREWAGKIFTYYRARLARIKERSGARRT